MTLVTRSLAHVYRPVVTWFLSIITLVVVTVSTIISIVHEVKVSYWVLIVGQSTKWWLLVIGVLLATQHLKLYVANGITRRSYLAGAAVFGVGTAVVYALLVPLGHGIETALWHLLGTPPAAYPEFSAATAVREIGSFLPGGLAALVTGAFIGAAFYRFHWLTGLLLIIPGLLPLAAAETFLGLYAAVPEEAPRFLPYAGGAAITVGLAVIAATGLGAWMRNVAIRPTAG